MKNLYKVFFNDYGCDYVVAKDWNEAGDKIMKIFPECEIKEIKYLARVPRNEEDKFGTYIHL